MMYKESHRPKLNSPYLQIIYNELNDNFTEMEDLFMRRLDIKDNIEI